MLLFDSEIFTTIYGLGEWSNKWQVIYQLESIITSSWSNDVHRFDLLLSYLRDSGTRLCVGKSARPRSSEVFTASHILRWLHSCLAPCSLVLSYFTIAMCFFGLRKIAMLSVVRLVSWTMINKISIWFISIWPRYYCPWCNTKHCPIPALGVLPNVDSTPSALVVNERNHNHGP